jgi:hypothetical protein
MQFKSGDRFTERQNYGWEKNGPKLSPAQKSFTAYWRGGPESIINSLKLKQERTIL